MIDLKLLEKEFELVASKLRKKKVDETILEKLKNLSQDVKIKKNSL